MAEQDLTGIWQGLYSYGGIGRQVGFTATLIETGGALYGTTHESDRLLGPASLEASLAGARAGQRVGFVKTYATDRDEFLPIAYEGVVSGDATEVEGTWSIRDGLSLSGRFLMCRPRPRARAVEAKKTVRA
jgi:hypothetical protein